MFEWLDNILCVQAGWLYEEGNIMTENCYKKLTYRKAIQVLRRACKGRPALVAYESMPERYKSAIEAITGDPYKKVEENELLKYIKEDTAALTFYRKYRYGEDKALPDETIREYYANVQVMNAIGELLAMRKAMRSKLGRRSMADVWKKISQSVNSLPSRQYPCRLPENDRRLKEKFNDYRKEGYTLFIHKGFGNINTEKLNDQVKLWILSQWANNIDRITSERHLLDVYNEHAEEMQKKGGEDARTWKPIRSEQTLHNFLFSDGIRNLWWGARYGELKSKEKFMYQHSTLMPTMRNSLWYSDGTKLNFFFRDDNGSISTMSVYEVMDVYSEVFVGYAFCETENYAAQREAFRRALLFAGEKPFQVTFDNQGGHKKMEATSFLSKLAHVAIRTKPYNGKSKTIEGAFGRFQQMLMKQKFFFTGQNVTAKSDESKANREFLLANKDNLPTLEEVKQIYLEYREKWNRGKHPKSSEGLTRLEMYHNSRNDALVEIRREDMIDLFCVEHASPVRVTPGGLTFENARITRKAIFATGAGDNYIPWKEFKPLQTNRQLEEAKATIKYVDDEIAKIQTEGIPAGVIVMWSGNVADIPAGWQLCDNSIIPGTNKRTPDLRGKFIVGYNNDDNEYKTVGNKGGNKEISLKPENTPKHRHLNGMADDNNWPFAEQGYINKQSSSSSLGTETRTPYYQGYTSYEGEAKPFDVRPPYYVLAFIIKIDVKE